jgi:hypothetical protein
VPVARARDLEPNPVDGVRICGAEPCLEPLGIVRGVLPLWQRHDAHVEPLRDRELHAAQRRVFAGRVGVEAEEDAPRQPSELFELPFRERGAHRRHDRLEARLSECDHVRVPLDDDSTVLLRDRGTREMEAVQDRRFVEELALRRVDVLPAKRIVVAQLASLETDDAPARVGEREHEPSLEVVGAAPRDEAGCGKLFLRELLARLLHERGTDG